MSPWAATYEDEARHFEITQKMRDWPRDTVNSELDEVMVNLVKLMIGFNADFLTLERRDIVEGAQLRYTQMLQRYLKHKFGEGANKKFSKALEVVAMAREASEIVDRKLPCMAQGKEQPQTTDAWFAQNGRL